MATITEDYVSFETAKLLKEKRFNGECDLFGRTDESKVTIQKACKIAYNQGIDDECVIIPTLQMAMKWLREIHNVNIEIHYNRFGKNYKYLIIYKPEVLDDIRSLSVFYYYEEAAEAAIEYSLKNLV